MKITRNICTALGAAMLIAAGATNAAARDTHPIASAEQPVDADRDGLSTHQQQALDIYRAIIAFRTARGHGQIPAMVDFLARNFSAAGFADEDIMISDYDSAGEHVQGLIIRYRGDHSSGEKPIVLLAHMDVVEALPQDWERDPFSLSEDDRYFYGRGTLDNKFGVANLSQAFIRLKNEAWQPNRDIYLVFSGDEETGMISTRAQAKWVAENIDPEFVLNSDAGGIALDNQFAPLAMRVQLAEKTYASFELKITNPGGHSSRPRRDNAIYELSRALTRIGDYQFPVHATPLTRSYFAALGQIIPGDLGQAMRRFANDPQDEGAIAILQANPETIGTLGTTCVATMVEAGHAENALPQTARAVVNCRIFPGTGVAATQERLRQIAGDDNITFRLITDVTESAPSILRDDIAAALKQSLKQRFGRDIPIIPYMEAGGTDGMHYRALGYQTVAISGGSSRPQDIFAHGLNEKMEKNAFFNGLDHWPIMLKQLADGP